MIFLCALAPFDELHGLVRKTFGVAQVLKDGLAALAGKVQLSFVYGSLAAAKPRQAMSM